MLFESSKRVLKNRLLGTGLESLQEFFDRTRALALDEQQMRGRLELERRLGLSRAGIPRGSYCSVHTIPCLWCELKFLRCMPGA